MESSIGFMILLQTVGNGFIKSPHNRLALKSVIHKRYRSAVTANAKKQQGKNDQQIQPQAQGGMAVNQLLAMRYSIR